MADGHGLVPETNGISVGAMAPRPTDVLTYYIIVLGGMQPQDAEPLDPACITLELGRAFENLSVDPVFAYLYSSPLCMQPDLIALHRVWANLDAGQKETLSMAFPSLWAAIETLTGCRFSEDGYSEDPNLTPETKTEG